MEESKTESSLYIETFKNEIFSLCEPYKHPRYLGLLGDFENRLLENLKKSLGKEIYDTLSSKGQSLPKDEGNELKQIVKNLLNEVLKDIPKSEELTTLEEKLLANTLKLSVSREIPPKLTKTLERKLKDCFNEYKKNDENQKKGIIRSIINREVAEIEKITGKKETKLTLEKRCAHLDEIIEDLWVPFSKSLLEGEFLRNVSYSRKLKEIVRKIRETYDFTLSEDVIYLHPIVPRIHELCQELSYVCECVRIQIKENKENKRVFHTPVSYLARTPYAGGLNSGEMLKANLFHDLGTKLIEMTRIDLSGVIDDQAISHLFLLHNQCHLLLKNEDSKLLDFPTNTVIEGIFRAIKAKTSLLLFQSFYKPSVTRFGGIDIADSITKPYRRAEKFEILYEGKKYYLTGQGSSKIKLLHEQIKDFESLSPADPPPSEDYSQGDILKYDEYIERGKNGRMAAKKIEPMEFLKGLLDNIDKEEQILHYPIDNLLCFMEKLRNMKNKQPDQTCDIIKYTKVMRFLLKCFYERLLIYKDFVAAEQKKETYANSFYKIDSTGLKIFISSFGCKLLHTQALQDEAYHKFNQIYREWLTEAQEKAMKKAADLEEIAKKTQSQQENMQSAVQKTTNEVNKIVDEAAKKAAKKAAEEAAEEAAEKAAEKATLDTRKEAISILSIFVALITFISVEVSILKSISCLADYLILTATIYIFISFIIGILYFRSIEGDQEKNLPGGSREMKEKKMRDPSRITLCISRIIAVAIIAAGICFKINSKYTGEDGDSPKISNGVENVNRIFLSGVPIIALPSPLDSVGVNASTNEKQGKTDSSTEKIQKK